MVRIALLATLIGTSAVLTGIALSKSTLAIDVLADRSIAIARCWPLRKVGRRVEAVDVPVAQSSSTKRSMTVSLLVPRDRWRGTALGVADLGSRSAIENQVARFNLVGGAAFLIFAARESARTTVFRNRKAWAIWIFMDDLDVLPLPHDLGGRA